MNAPLPILHADGELSDCTPHVRSAIVLQSLLSRQSHWPLTDPAPTDDELALIFDAALRAPDHARLRPWRFVLVRGDARDALGQILVDVAAARCPDDPPGAHEHRRQRAHAAPLIVALGAAVDAGSHVPEVEQLLSMGAATMNVLNAIHALGYGAFWATGADAYDAHLHRALGFRATERLLGFLFVGSPPDDAKHAKRADRNAHVREWTGLQDSPAASPLR
ncbi:nitroreductase family protein [Paraburkholderia phosphatilytica]|uniref:nitroreductase family protein n=1 Tax=Paraburkholderia phosphatilytica TaxID=2282883 RepID=UPI000E5002CE|nr:nitroreductase [Paraburkholderia phosphatilytica]